MTNDAIAKRQAAETLKFETAKAINKLLEKGCEEAEKAGLDGATWVSECLELVTEDDS